MGGVRYDGDRTLKQVYIYEIVEWGEHLGEVELQPLIFFVDILFRLIMALA